MFLMWNVHSAKLTMVTSTANTTRMRMMSRLTIVRVARTLSQSIAAGRVLATVAGGGDLTIAQYTAQFGQFAPGERIELRIGGHDESFRIADHDVHIRGAQFVRERGIARADGAQQGERGAQHASGDEDDRAESEEGPPVAAPLVQGKCAHRVTTLDAQIHDFRGTDFAIRTMITDADAPRTLNQTRVLATVAGGGDLMRRHWCRASVRIGSPPHLVEEHGERVLALTVLRRRGPACEHRARPDQ